MVVNRQYNYKLITLYLNLLYHYISFEIKLKVIE